VDLGGIEFLSQLRLHCDESLHPLIDEVLEQLLQQPFTNPPPPVPKKPPSVVPELVPREVELEQGEEKLTMNSSIVNLKI